MGVGSIMHWLDFQFKEALSFSFMISNQIHKTCSLLLMKVSFVGFSDGLSESGPTSNSKYRVFVYTSDSIRNAKYGILSHSFKSDRHL